MLFWTATKNVITQEAERSDTTGQTLTETLITDETGNGKLVEVYATDNVVTDIVVTTAYIGVVKAVNANTKLLTIEFAPGATSYTIVTDTGYGTFVKGDFVVAEILDTTDGVIDTNVTTLAGAETLITALYAPTKVEGKVTAKTSIPATVTMDGTKYFAAAEAYYGKKATDATVSTLTAATVYLDEYGYAMYVDTTPVATVNLLAVNKAYATMVDGQIVYMVDGITPTGETKSLKVGSDQSGLLFKVVSYGAPAVGTGIYTLADVSGSLSDGTSVAADDGSSMSNANGAFTEAGYVEETSLTLAKGAVSFDQTQKNYYADNVKFIFVNNTAKAVTVLDGAQAVSATNCIAVYEMKAGVAYVTAVYVMGNTVVGATESSDIVFVKGGKTGDRSVTDVISGVPTAYADYSAFINGEKVENFYAADGVILSGFYKVNVLPNGQYQLDASTLYEGNTGKFAVSADALVTGTSGEAALSCGSADYRIDENTKFVDATMTISSFSDLKTQRDSGKEVAVMVMYDADTKLASYVYVTAIGDYSVTLTDSAAGFDVFATALAVNANTTIKVVAENTTSGALTPTVASTTNCTGGAAGTSTAAGASYTSGDITVTGDAVITITQA